MLKRTKAANKAAIEDAVDNENTAVTLGGLAQPDEDDYGYVSQEASAFYDKLMEKYTSTPSEEPKFSKKSFLKSSAADLNNTKDRVRMALLRQEEEELMPHKRKRKTKEEKLKETESVDRSQNESDYGKTKECEEEMPEKFVKPRRPPPQPQMDFLNLLKMAEKKQFEPVKIVSKVKEEDERPMTKKQRAEYMKEKEWRLRKEGKLPPLTASKQVTIQSQRNSLSQSSEERSRTQKSSLSAADSGSGPRSNQHAVDRIRDQRSSQLSLDGQREQTGSQPSGYGIKDQINGRFSDQRTGRPSGDINRDQRNRRPLEGNRPPKSNRSSEDGNFSIPKCPKVNSSSRIDKHEKSPHRIPKLSDSSSRSVKLQGNSDSKVGKERSRDISGKLPVKNSHTSSAFGQGSANRNSPEERKDTSINSSSSGNSKNYNLSGYSKKLQESLLANLQEKGRSGKLSEANKFLVPGAPTSKYPKNCDSGSFNMSREAKQQSKFTRSSESKDVMKEGSLIRSSAKPFTSSHKINETSRGVLSSKSQESSVRSKPGHEIPTRDARKAVQIPSKDVKQRQFPLSDAKTCQSPPACVKPRQFPSANVKPRQFPPADIKPRPFPPADVRLKLPSKRYIEDSDEEYDPELDDFIDDGPDESEDVSKHIKEIFGYDRSRYREMDDDDDECMESSFSQQLKEEFVSTKMGILEDLEDIKMEKRALERKKKLMMKKKRI
ncbi:hypothetical protein B7P43_G10415 [Cryptotermes secundus]|nr:hypothetical protein B7P43_G10415 [Cryptotermes secundus]